MSRDHESRQKTFAAFIKRHFPNGVTPEELVSAATPKTSPIHKYFNWDDRKAAEAYRLFQARNFILELKVEFKEQHTKAYHSVYVEELEERRYLPIKQVSARSDLIDQVIESALKNLTLWKERYGQYKEFRDVTLAINKTERTYYGKKGKNRSHTTN